MRQISRKQGPLAGCFASQHSCLCVFELHWYMESSSYPAVQTDL